MDTFIVRSNREAETSRIAETIAPHLRLGDVILLSGTLACGKTFFVKSLAHALGFPNCVTSPTYALVHTYKIKPGNLLHIDAYRLSDVREFRDLGLDEYLPDSITVIEWGDKVRSEFENYLCIAFDLAGSAANHRLLTFSCVGRRWNEEMPTLKKELGGRSDEPRACC